MAFAASAADAVPFAIFSSSVSTPAAICSQVGIAGGALPLSSWSPNTFSCSSPASVSSSHAAWTDGRSETVLYHLTCTSGCIRYETNFQAASRFFEFLNTDMLLPPMNDV